MSDGFIRHLISFLAVVIASLIYWTAYTSGVNGWWWTFIIMLFVYAIVYKLVDV